MAWPTSTPPEQEWANTTVVSDGLADFVTELKQQSGGEIGVHGSISLVQSLLKAGLVASSGSPSLPRSRDTAAGAPGRRGPPPAPPGGAGPGLRVLMGHFQHELAHPCRVRISAGT